MARPRKDNAEYFTHDKDMRNDPKLRAVRKKFGNEGYAVWNFLLEVITDSDNFEIEWNPLAIELLGGDFDVETGYLTDLVDYMVKIGLLQREQDVIYSSSMKKRFEPLLSKRERDRNRVIASENPHSKVKERKGKESKEEISKEYLFDDTHTIFQIFEIFYFRNFVNPEKELETFLAHYKKTGGLDRNGQPVKDWLAAAQLWTPANKDRTRIPVDMLGKWRKVYELFNANTKQVVTGTKNLPIILRMYPKPQQSYERVDVVANAFDAAKIRGEPDLLSAFQRSIAPVFGATPVNFVNF